MRGVWLWDDKWLAVHWTYRGKYSILADRYKGMSEDTCRIKEI